jgi:hypothetical protein
VLRSPFPLDQNDVKERSSVTIGVARRRRRSARAAAAGVAAEQVHGQGRGPAEPGQQGQVFEQARGGRSPDALGVQAVGDAGGEDEDDDERPGQPGVDGPAAARLAEDAWAVVARQQIAGITSFLDITRDGLDLVGPDDGRAARIRQAHTTFEWMANVFKGAPPLHPDPANPNPTNAGPDNDHAGDGPAGDLDDEETP